MIKYFEGTVFNANTYAIVNTVNCDGFMGAGLALEFALRFPQMLNDYEKKCNDKTIKTGCVDYFKENNITIINFPTKNSFKFPSHIKWIEDGLISFVNTYKENNIKSVAFPKLGCSNGGLNWNEVKVLMEKYLSNLDIDVYICLDELKEAAGKEKEMLDKFNNINISDLASQIKLSQKQQSVLENKKPFKRFWMISKEPSIGKTTYKKLFEHFYNCNNVQMKLF